MIQSDFTLEELKALGWTDEAIHAIHEQGLGIYRVRVLQRCYCPSCKAGLPWYRCSREDSVELAAYAVVGCDNVPFEDGLNSIKAEHPGCSLIY